MLPSALPLHTGQLLLVSDKLAAPGDFLLHNILAHRLKEGSRCLVVSFSENYLHWQAIAARSTPNINLTHPVVSGLLVLIDCLSDIGRKLNLPSTPTDLPLIQLYEKIRDSLQAECLPESNKGNKPHTIIIENVSSLTWMGVSLIAIKRFVRALRSLSTQMNASLVIRHHLVEADGLDNLLHGLLQQCAYHAEVLPLSSGRSGAISGEIALHRGPGVKDGDSHNPNTVTRRSAVQYLLVDSGPIFFERGTGAGVL